MRDKEKQYYTGKNPDDVGKRGPWTDQEREFIAQNYSAMTAKTIGAQLHRSPTTIQKYINKNLAGRFTGAAKEAQYDIKQSAQWESLTEQFSKKELKVFMFHYSNILSQFRNDIFPTEELQVIDACRLQVLTDRSLINQHKCMKDIILFEKQLNDAKKAQDFERVHNLERQIATLRASTESLNSDHKTMLDQKIKILREMKATRDQRVKVLDQTKVTFITWMKQILYNKALREKLGFMMEKERLAANCEYEKLSEYYAFGEDDLDLCILSCDTIGKDDENEKPSEEN